MKLNIPLWLLTLAIITAWVWIAFGQNFRDASAARNSCDEFYTNINSTVRKGGVVRVVDGDYRAVLIVARKEQLSTNDFTRTNTIIYTCFEPVVVRRVDSWEITFK